MCCKVSCLWRPRSGVPSLRRKVLFVVNGHAYTAAHRLPLLEAAKRAGYSVSCAAPSSSQALSWLTEAGWRCHEFPLSRQGTNIAQEGRSVWTLARLYRAVRPDLVHHATVKPVLYGSLAARLAGIPAVVNAVTGLGYVFTSERLRARALRSVVRLLYRSAFEHANGRVIFQNRDDLTTLERCGVLPDNVAVLIPGSGVDVGRFVPAPELVSTPLVVLPARMLWDKGVGDFVEAARRLRAEGSQATFVLVGGTDFGNPAAIPESQLRRWVDEGVVEWWGEIGDMVPIYHAATVVVLPSYGEGMPKVLLEAAACQRPVVSTTVPGCRDAVVAGETGYLVAARNIEELAHRIRQLLRDPDLRRKMGVAGRLMVVERFSVARVIKATLEVYENLLSRAYPS